MPLGCCYSLLGFAEGFRECFHQASGVPGRFRHDIVPVGFLRHIAVAIVASALDVAAGTRAAHVARYSGQATVALLRRERVCV